VELSKKKISSLSDELNKEITFDAIKDVLKRGMEEIMDEALVFTELTKDEKNLAEKLYREK